ncbi:GNAT family N-acetyltransferase [Oxalobacteraceae bacterium R-40]|uniref:GNAT family N-acetyltransferase n=1 Tax=Keguizhuia sedimenti TaxID=3064264 RepID=A0ABU1BJH1_9BURK|nr:GNAT family N-acetyltransferase [Oxalobacteraceae bacterium R-40]
MITYKLNHPLEADDVIRVFDSSGINRPTRDPERIRRMLKNANLIISAWDGNRLVGVCRALTDFSYCCFLSDLAIDRNHQHRGIGREMIALLRKEIGDEVCLIVQAAAASMSYYPRLGFEKMENGFMIGRKR